MLITNKLSYAYPGGREILRNVNLMFEYRKIYTLFGESGSGKTTFLSILAGLDSPLSGELVLDGNIISKGDLNRYRREQIGFVFQDFNLIPFMNGLENVMCGLTISTGKSDSARCLNYLESVGISKEKAYRKISTLSGGEKQRVAIARALAGDKKIILADEPTGNLDRATSLEIMKVFRSLAHDLGKCVIIVTHFEDLGSLSDVSLYLNQETFQFEMKEVGQ